MTRDDIIRMAREAGGGLESDYTNISALARFAALAAAAQQALEALEEATNYTGCEAWSPSMTDECLAAAAALRAALAQQEQEPVAWLTPRTRDSYARPDLGYETASEADYGAFPVYTHPAPQRKPLTRQEALGLWKDRSDGPSNSEIISYCRAIERAHEIG